MANAEHLQEFLFENAKRPLDPAIEALAAAATARHKGTLALLFYGSCLRDGGNAGVVDLYLLVDDLKQALAKPISALACSLLPPNVYYLEIEHQGETLRAKYAILSLSQFEKGTSSNWFHPYLWARFSQPVAVKILAEDPEQGRTAKKLRQALANAVSTMISETLPLLPDAFAGDLPWIAGFGQTYRTELRAEGPERARAIVAANSDYYKKATALTLVERPDVECAKIDGEPRYYHSPKRVEHLKARARWALRRPWGKLLSVARLIKAAFTFNGGARYLAWKIQRHSGHHIIVTPWMERHPLLAAFKLFWRLYRKGAFR